MLQTELTGQSGVRHPILPAVEVIRRMVEEAELEIERISKVRL